MPDTPQPQAIARMPHAGLWALAGVAVCALAAMATLLVTALRDWPVAVAFVVPVAMVLGFFLLYDTRLGLCGIAFTIPLIALLEVEILGVTVSVSELLILALAAKEGIRFVSGGAAMHPLLPPRTLLLYLLFSIVAVFTGVRDGWPLRAVLQDFRQFTEFVVLFLLVLQSVRTVPQVRAVLACFVLGGTLIALHGILQRFTGLGMPVNVLLNDLVYHKGIRSGSFYGPTALGGFMVLAGGSSLGLMLSAPKMAERLLWLACLSVCVTAAIYTGTRASWLAFVVAFGCVFLFVRKTPFLLAVAIGGGTILAAVLGTLIVQRMQKIAFTKAERSLLERVHYYTVAWHIFRSHPLLGLGYGCYYEQTPILANGRYIAVPFDPEAPPATVHSAYLQILVKTGLAGLATFLIFLGDWFRRVVATFRVWRDDEFTFNLFLAVTASLAGYLFHSTFENFFQWPIMAQAFWLMLGLSLVLSGILRDKGEGRTSS